MADSRRENMVHYKFSQAAQDLIRLHGGEPPDDHYLVVSSAEVDTDGKTMKIIYDFMPYPDEPEEDDEDYPSHRGGDMAAEIQHRQMQARRLKR